MYVCVCVCVCVCISPAIVCALGLSSQKKGSQVIICTDGMANIGLGALGVYI